MRSAAIAMSFDTSKVEQEVREPALTCRSFLHRMVDSVYVRNAQVMRYPSLDGPTTFKMWSKESDKDCSDEDRKWNNCDSTSGLPLLELHEISGPKGEPQQRCQT